MRKMMVFALAAIAATIALAWGSGQARASGPAEIDVIDVTGDQFVCDTTTYTILQGSIRIVFHFTETPNGNVAVTGTVTPIHVIASDGTNTVQIVGADWFGFTFNSKTGNAQGTETEKFQLVSLSGGGTLDNVNVIMHFSPNGNEFTFDFGTCATPPED